MCPHWTVNEDFNRKVGQTLLEISTALPSQICSLEGSVGFEGSVWFVGSVWFEGSVWFQGSVGFEGSVGFQGSAHHLWGFSGWVLGPVGVSL